MDFMLRTSGHKLGWRIEGQGYVTNRNFDVTQVFRPRQACCLVGLLWIRSICFPNSDLRWPDGAGSICWSADPYGASAIRICGSSAQLHNLIWLQYFCMHKGYFLDAHTLHLACFLYSILP